MLKDHFKRESNYFSEPCCLCAHRHIPFSNFPCNKCLHNVSAVSKEKGE